MSHRLKPFCRQSGFILVACLLAASVAMGISVYYRYARAERYLRSRYVAMTVNGRTLTVKQCVDAVVRFRKTCNTLRTLCDAFSPRLMAACLIAADRSGYCTSLSRSTTTTDFGFKQCRERKLSRAARKACAACYRVIDAYCKKARGNNK